MMIFMTCGIYCYIDLKNNSIIYIGKDSHINKNQRHKEHYKKSHYFKQQINKVLQNNPDRYKYKILKKGCFSQNLLNALEIIYIRKYNPLFNFTYGGEGVLGYKHSESTKQLLSEIAKKQSAKPWLGKKLPLDMREKISLTESLLKNTTGYYRVIKDNSKRYKNGRWVYKYYDDVTGERIQIVSVDIEKLKQKVIKKGLKWLEFK